MADDTSVSQVDTLDQQMRPDSNSQCCGNHPSFDKHEEGSRMSPLVAVLQFTATANKEKNFGICSDLIRKARRRGVEVNNQTFLLQVL